MISFFFILYDLFFFFGKSVLISLVFSSIICCYSFFSSLSRILTINDNVNMQVRIKVYNRPTYAFKGEETGRRKDKGVVSTKVTKAHLVIDICHVTTTMHSSDFRELYVILICIRVIESHIVYFFFRVNGYSITQT